MRLFIGGKWTTQVADQIAQIFGEMLIAHLIEVIAPLLIGHDHQTQHFFSSQFDRVGRFFWLASIFPVNGSEIPRSGGKKSTTKGLIVQMQGDASPLDLVWCHVPASPFA